VTPLARADSDRAFEPAHAPDANAREVTIVAHDIGPTGGMEGQLTELVLGLRRLGHDVTVIARRCALPAGARVTFHRVRGPARPFLLAYPWFAIAGSLAVRRSRRGLVQAVGAIVLNRVDVVAVHYCQQAGVSTASRSTTLYRIHARLAAVIRRFGERVCFRRNRSATFVCVSDGVAEEVRDHFPELAGRVITIYNGIPTEAFTPGLRRAEADAWRHELGIERERLLAAFVGSEWERKGLDPVIRALARADGRWELVVAGSGDRRHYQKLADSLGVGERVRWLGVQSDVALVYQLADAFVMASSYETFSLVTFEAAASGLPILATAVNGVRELIDDRQNGFLITREPDAIARALDELAADPALRARLGEAARAAALAFDRQRMVAEHDALYARLRADAPHGGRHQPPAAAAKRGRGSQELQSREGSRGQTGLD
jgi:UDP-glucose:(heptosyl)LPS alpha-1,3-glucosyltransferase